MTAPNPPEPAPTVSDLSDLAAGNPGPAGLGEPSPPCMTQAQAEAILAELKIVKQRLLWVLVIAGCFAARALFFHY